MRVQLRASAAQHQGRAKVTLPRDATYLFWMTEAPTVAKALVAKACHTPFEDGKVHS